MGLELSRANFQQDERAYTLLWVKETESSEPGKEQKDEQEEQTVLTFKQTAEGKYFYLALDICITTLHYCALFCIGYLLPNSGLPGSVGECQGE